MARAIAKVLMRGALALSPLLVLTLRAQTDAPQPPAPAPLLSPDQLDTLVAPIALYPDQLLGQVLAASTYPLELIEAQQWIQEQRGLRGPQLIEAAKQQNWDASVQAMAAFPDVLAMLTRDVRWTTDLGNAFLAQQADVMAAIQQMRARAQSNGRLRTTPEQTVTTQYDDGQSAIGIQPADPQVVYVPQYNPVYVWGPPAWGAYPALYYPPSGFGFGPAVFLGSLFSGLLGFGGWGWGLSWLGHGAALFFNALFCSHFGFGGGHFAGGFGERSVWVHDPGHRLGVAYPSQVTGRFNGGSRFAGSNWRSFNGNSRGFGNNERSLGNNSRGFGNERGFAGNERGFAGNERGLNGSQRGFANNERGSGNNARGFANNERSFNSNARNFGSSSPQNSRGASEGYGSGYRGSTPGESNRGFSSPSYGTNRGFAGESRGGFSGQESNRMSRDFGNSGRSSRNSSTSHFNEPRASSQHFAAPHSSGHASAPRSSGGHVSAPKGSSHSGGGKSGHGSKHH